MLVCPKCGVEIKSNAKFCHSCGTEIRADIFPQKAKITERGELEKISSKIKKPWITGLLDIILPGLGFIYLMGIGSIIAGIILMIITYYMNASPVFWIFFGFVGNKADGWIRYSIEDSHGKEEITKNGDVDTDYICIKLRDVDVDRDSYNGQSKGRCCVGNPFSHRN